MPGSYFECTRPTCRFRFPVTVNQSITCCPKCGAPIENTGVLLPSNSLAGLTVTFKFRIWVLLDNIRSAYNVGSIFRTADGAGIGRVVISGITPAPTHPQAAKTALGAHLSIPWEQTWNAAEYCQAAKQQGFTITILEKTENAVSFFALPQPVLTGDQLLILGSEIEGVDPAIRAMADHTFYIPMYGNKESLNVSVAFGIAAYWVRHRVG